MGIDKAFDKRLRILELQKAPTVEQFMETPLMTYTDLGERCKEKFKIENAPSNAVICQWLKPDRRKELLEFMEVQIKETGRESRDGSRVV